MNEYGWYTYNGKLVLGTATPYLLKYGYAKREGTIYFRYYNTIKLRINGQEYEGIILDSCGACMKKDIIDLFVSNSQSTITTQIEIKQNS